MANKRLALPYLLPYFVYVGCAALPLDPAPNYAVRLVATAAAIAWAWRKYGSVFGPGSKAVSTLAGIGAGLVGVAVWIPLVGLFTEPGGEPWTDTAFALRLVAAGTLVAFFEEMALRGFVLRLVVQWQRHGEDEALEKRSVHDLEPGAWTPLAVGISTVLFAAGHGLAEMPAAVAYGLLMAGLWIWRKDLWTCIVAHAVTNIALALYVRSQGAWHLW